MTAEGNLNLLLKNMQPELNEGEYVFVSVKRPSETDIISARCIIKEEEGITLVMEKRIADERKHLYNFIGSWITLKVHSSLEAVGLTAAFSTALTKNNISCNVIAGYYHDHIFVNKGDAEKAMRVLNELSETGH